MFLSRVIEDYDIFDYIDIDKIQNDVRKYVVNVS